jgi:hypothetical protein
MYVCISEMLHTVGSSAAMLWDGRVAGLLARATAEQQLAGHAAHVGLLVRAAGLTSSLLLLLLLLLLQELLCSDATHDMLVDVGMPVIHRGGRGGGGEVGGAGVPLS